MPTTDRIISPKGIRNLVVVSDIHAACRLALCPPWGAKNDDGGTYRPSRTQRWIWSLWEEFWGGWVPEVTRGEPYAVEVNGDAIEGNHHGSVTQISHNPADQEELAYEMLSPLVNLAEGRFYMVRGTEAHVAASASDEERLARRLESIPNEDGQFARWDLWFNLGGKLIHFLHHIGTTGSSAHEASAVNAELVAELTAAARWGYRRPDMIVRSHRHASISMKLPTETGEISAIVTPGWQAKTPFAWKVAGARLSPPQIGGIVIRIGDDGEIYHKSFVNIIGCSKTVVL
jgi:hypothetical protein